MAYLLSGYILIAKLIQYFGPDTNYIYYPFNSVLPWESYYYPNFTDEETEAYSRLNNWFKALQLE